MRKSCRRAPDPDDIDLDGIDYENQPSDTEARPAKHPSLTWARREWLWACAEQETITALELKIVIEIAAYYVTLPKSRNHFLATGKLHAFPSQDTLAHTLGVLRQTVRQAVLRLVARHLLKVTKKGGRGRNRRNEYELTLPENTSVKRNSSNCVSSVEKTQLAGTRNATSRHRKTQLQELPDVSYRNNKEASAERSVRKVARSAHAVGTASLAPGKKDEDAPVRLSDLLESEAVTNLCAGVEKYFESSLVDLVQSKASLLGKSGARIGVLLLLALRTRHAVTGFLASLNDEPEKKERLALVEERLLDVFNDQYQHYLADYVVFLKERVQVARERWRDRQREGEDE